MRTRIVLLLASVALALGACQTQPITPITPTGPAKEPRLPAQPVGTHGGVHFTGFDGTAGHPKKGQTEFVSVPANGGGGRGGVATGEDAAGGAPSAGASSNAGSGSGSSAQPRDIQEADIYKVVGDTLYVLNTYRGLQVVDVANPAAPSVLARVPLIGTPVDLYVRGSTAYVVVSDYFMYGCWEGAFRASPTFTSQVWAIDVSNRVSPVVLGKLPIDGDVEQTRIVGEVLYVQSRQWSWWYPGMNGTSASANLTFVASFDISNSAQMTQVDRVDFPSSGWDTHANFTANRITISQAGYDYSGSGYQPITNFQVIDSSDPAGTLTLGASFSAPGQVTQRWAMDFDDATGIFRAVSQVGWNSGATIDLWSIATPDTATHVGHLDLVVPESVTAARFDGNRAYVVTAYCVDPLWIVDTTDPTQPVLTGTVSMPGALDFVEPRGDQLIAFGHNSDACHSSGNQGLNVSMFDVANPTSPQMTDRVEFGSGYTYVNSRPDDFRKVFQVLDSLGLILVPYSSWAPQTWSYVGGTQLVDFDSAGLTLRGFAEHAGFITRAFPVQDKLVALSDTSLQVLDIANRDNPVELTVLDLARSVNRLSVLNGYAIELSGDWYRGDTELVVTEANKPDSAHPIARLKVAAPYAQTYLDGNILWLSSWSYDYSVGTSKAWLQAVDLTDPTQPFLRGKLDLDPNDISSWGWGWGYGSQTQLVGHALALHPYFYRYTCTGCTPQPPDLVKVIDLTDADHPVLASTVTLPDSDWSWGLTTVGNFAWITHYEWQGSTWQNVKYYVDRIDLTDPKAPVLLAKVNVPGVFFAASDDGNTLYTEDVSWTPNWTQTTTSIHELGLLANGTAVLIDSTYLSGYPGAQTVANEHAYVQTWDWTQSQSQAVLTTVDLASMTISDAQTAQSNSGWLVKAAAGKLFMSAGWYDSGILVYDLANPGVPSFQGFVRTDGYVEDVVVANQTAYLPSGYYGVPMIDLTPGTPLPQN